MSTIGWALFQATLKALLYFREHLPPGVLPQLDKDAEAHDAFVREWATALAGTSLEAILDAAQRWMRDPEKVDKQDRTRIPQMASFAMYARAVDMEHWRPKLVLEPQRPSNADTAQLRNSMTMRALTELGSRELAQEVWSVLWRMADSSAQRQAVREGRVTQQDFDDAILIVRESQRLARARA